MWQECLSKLEQCLSEQEFRTWIKPLSYNLHGKLFTIYAPNKFFLDWIQSKYKHLIVDNLVLENDLVVQFSITNKYSGQKQVQLRTNLTNDNISSRNLDNEIKPTSGPQLDMFSGKLSMPNLSDSKLDNNNVEDSHNSTYISSSDELYGFDKALNLPKAKNNVNFGMRLRDQFTFDNFVEGKSNEVAKAASMQISVNPGSVYNPLFLYGGSGLGKTHLMHAIGNEVCLHHQDVKVLYVSSEKFVKDFVDAVRLHAMDQFQDHYRSVDLLLVDDIQFIAGKGRSQEEFFHTFNTLLDNGKQIILSCDKYPKEIEGMEDRLRSRFINGLTVTIDMPDLETRVAILMKKAYQFGVTISHDIAFFIAKYIRSNVRELEGALKRVITHARVTKTELTTKFVAETLKDIISIQQKLVKVDNIQKVVADYYGLKVSDLLSKQKSRDIARPRQLAMALAKELTTHSLPEIGQFFGKRDHTTVLHAVRRITKLKKENFQIKDDYQELSRKLAN